MRSVSNRVIVTPITDMREACWREAFAATVGVGDERACSTLLSVLSSLMFTGPWEGASSDSDQDPPRRITKSRLYEYEVSMGNALAL